MIMIQLNYFLVDIPEGVIVAYYNGLRFNAGDRIKVFKFNSLLLFFT